MTTHITVLLAVLILGSCERPDTSERTSTPEHAGMWAADSIIDIHGHTGMFEGYDLSVPTLRANIDSFGIRMVFISNVDGANLPGTTLNLDAKSANDATLKVVLEHSDKVRGIAWARPADGSPSDVEPFIADTQLDGPNPRPFVGVKLHPVMNQFPADAPIVDPYFDICRTYGVPVVYHSDKPGTFADPVLIYRAAKRHPDVPVILYHMVFFGPHDSAIDVVEQAVQHGDADLYLEISQADPQAVLQAIRRVGSERVLFGTDATYYGTGHYAQYADLVSLLRSELTPLEFRNVMRANALRLFPYED